MSVDSKPFFTNNLVTHIDEIASYALRSNYLRVKEGFNFIYYENNIANVVSVPAGYLYLPFSLPFFVKFKLQKMGLLNSRACVIYQYLREYMTVETEYQHKQVNVNKILDIYLLTLKIEGVSESDIKLFKFLIKVKDFFTSGKKPLFAPLKKRLEDDYVIPFSKL